MGRRNDIFKEKYNELDRLCREKYNMFRTRDGKRNNLSAIKKFAESLEAPLKEKLLGLITLRNVVIHEDAAEINETKIRELDSFLVMAKQSMKDSASQKFDLLSYKTHNEKKLTSALEGVFDDLDDDIPFEKRKKIIDEGQRYINKLKSAKKMDEAKKAVRDCYHYIDNIDSHPIVIAAELDELRRQAIEQVQDSLNEVYSERKNPFVRKKANEIAQRYIALIRGATTEERIEDLAEKADDELSDLWY